jgi:two-component system phosphate regulon sensor histidine kinase PhoR
VRLPRSLQWRIAAAYTALIFVTMGAVSIYLIDFINDRFIDDLEDRLVREATIIGQSTGSLVAGPDARAAIEAFASSVDGHVTLVDGEGQLIADSLGLPDASDSEITEALLGRIVRNSRQVQSYGGGELRYAAVPIQSDGAVVGVARVGVPTSSISGDINRVITTVLFAAVVVGVLSILLGWYVVRRTTRSMRSVTSGARQLASGDLDHRVPALGNDESRDLAIAFNRMARTIRSTVTALEGERSKLSAVLDTMADGVVVADSNGDVTLVNAAAEKMLGLTPPSSGSEGGSGGGQKTGGAVGSRLAGAVWDHDLMRLVKEAIELGEPHYGEVALSASHRTVSAVATPIVQGGAEGVLLTLHDLTRRRRIDTTRREFVSNVSHELRSPLASVKAMVETLQGGASNDHVKSEDFLGRINDEVDRMTAIVSELLELSRLESGRIEMNAEPFALAPVVSGVMESLQLLADSGGVKLHSAVPADLPNLAGEKAKISQVLVNLVDNALRFTSESGEVGITAATSAGFVKVTVTDSGPGIAPEHLPHLFERFYKVDRSRRGGGTGLGLAIVRHIIQAHGGKVAVKSEVGRGTRFSFTVPVAPDIGNN